jgi:hypothetical protein
MSTRRKKSKWNSDKYERDIMKIISDYIAETGDTNWDHIKVAQWAINNGRWEQRKTSAVKELAKDISRAARTKSFPNEHGEEVRQYHSWRLGHDQPTFWSSIDTITVEHMAQSINSRREKLVNGAVKAIIDAEYFNDHHNSGDPIRVETDLTRDVTEKRQSGLYDDMPPEEPGEQP